uniref:30S ribosomal protein S8 n=1 Tax=Globicatella sulfidifaciens TaxID=136093 RepID=UPI0023F3D2E7|nr:30S ribosomal protein S8 [Globicatella sulfidifaciens]
MVMTDPIADFLTRIRNANRVGHKTVSAPSSNMKVAIAEILKNEGFIKGYEVIEDGKQNELTIQLKYGRNNEKVITGIKRISKPGLRVYAKNEDLPKVLNGLGIAIVSTSNGLVTDKQARKEGIGGEVLAYVW